MGQHDWGEIAWQLGYRDGQIEGCQRVVLGLASRFGQLEPALGDRVTACRDVAALKSIIPALAAATDHPAVQWALGRLPAPPPRNAPWASGDA